MTTPNKDQIHEVLEYSPSTGVFVWRVARGRCSAGSRAGYDTGRGYRAIRVFGQILYEHRAAFLYMNGYMPEEVDHANGVRSDNRWENLRPSNRLDNSKNMQRPISNKSGHIGVFWNAGKKKWTSKIKVNQKDIHLGHFSCKRKAVAARVGAEVEHGFHANHGRHGVKVGVSA